MGWKDLLLLPNILTLIRIVLVFPAILLLDYGFLYWACFLIFFVFITDFLDGWVARKWNKVSQLGSILDPVADKFVVLAFFGYYFFQGDVPILYFLLILVRDFSQLSAVPILLFWKKIKFQVKPKLIPKWGTALNFVILGILLISSVFSFPLPDLYPRNLGYFSKESIPSVLFLFLYSISGIIETYILLTFIPRFIAIYQGKHDTFE